MLPAGSNVIWSGWTMAGEGEGAEMVVTVYVVTAPR